ncbi:putative nucleotidyltransferase [Thermocatellispora tengchongensis]|uniref:Putative nucleotidyltransferase n=1 Tax=Thermocatellispora tengchongensis TaxID=1073253 RepID=A0A840PQS4_9ACTN|nr:nucleotidyltransferase domain-containing protein [Thermocatellispora tengchongensis]MBB5140121.1 putative nucleotidyltransferase [Thermocatellispora tengchongensis]
MPVHETVAPLLDRFLREAREAVPLTAMWVHGSLALGDYRPGRSDLDLIAVPETEPDEPACSPSPAPPSPCAAAA